MSRVLIAVPTYENIYPDTFRSIYSLDTAGHEADFDFFRGYDVANARNAIASATLDHKYDYVLMIDNDAVLPQDALANLLETEGAYPLGHSVAVGYMLSRPIRTANSTGKTTVFKFANGSYRVADAYTADELKALRDSGKNHIQVRGSGLGCALIHRDIFNAVKFPWFKWTVYGDGTQLSEDLGFCEKLRKCKIPVYVDTRVACGHMMRHIDYA